MKTVAIIPARGGSKGIKDKNIIDFAGKPLIYHVLDVCLLFKKIDIVVVTTDSSKISSVVKQEYPDVMIINRPPELSDDNASSESALLHAITVLDAGNDVVDNILFVQATSPLTRVDDLGNLLNLLDDYDSAAFYTEDYGFFFDLDEMNTPRIPRQHREPRKREAGNAWAFKKNIFLQEKSRVCGKNGLCKIDHPYDLEIDEMIDLTVVESVSNTISL